MNLVRDPRFGRAFETLGEDRYLAGSLGAAEIQGVQSTGVMAQVKDLAVYNRETNRNKQDCVRLDRDDRFVNGLAHVRTSTMADSPVLVFNRGEWEAFELGVFNGEFSMPV